MFFLCLRSRFSIFAPMKKIIYILLLFVISVVSEAAPKVKDPVVMTVGGLKVTRFEFAAFYNKNSQIGEGQDLTFDQFVDMYVAYKLKVAEALSQHIDTTQAYKDELELYRQQLVETFRDQSYWQDSLISEIISRIPYEVRASHILLMVDQDAPDSLVEAKRATIEDYRRQIEEGLPFDSLATLYSDDPSGKRGGGDLGYFRLFQMVYPFEDASYSTPVGGMSICRSQFGFHLIKVTDKREIPLYRINPQIVKMIQDGKAEEPVLGQLRQLVASDEGRIAKGKEMLEAKWPESEIVQTPEYKAMYQEYHDGILLFEVANEAVWNRPNRDPEGLESFFLSHKENYRFETPRFKGAFIECADDEALVKALTDIYSSHDYVEAANLVRSTVIPDTLLTPNPRQPRFHIVNGLFKPGDNPYIDERLGISSEKTNREDMPVHMTFGQVLEMPETAEDVRNQVVADYQDQLEDEFVARLKSKFAVKLNKKELDKMKKEFVSNP